MDAAAWDKKYEETELVWGAPPNELLVEYATALPHGQALDLACGEGRNALWLATRGWEVTGIDYSAVAIEKARTIAARSPDRFSTGSTTGAATSPARSTPPGTGRDTTWPCFFTFICPHHNAPWL